MRIQKATRLGFRFAVSLVVMGTMSGAMAAEPAVSNSSPPDSASNSVLEEVIVTATKRATNEQTTAIAMSVLSSADLANRQLDTFASISQSLPNVHFGESEGMAQISIRGVGFNNVTVGGEARVAFHEDGIYFSRPDNVLGTLFDVSQVEVLRGPQGTLYGRNSTAGAINIITNDPTDTPTGYITADFGSYSLAKFDGAISGPLGDGFEGRIAFESVDRDGYGRNLVDGGQIQDEHERAIRAKLKYTDPNGTFGATLAADYLKQNDNSLADNSYAGAGGFTAAGAPVTPYGFLYGGTVAATGNPYDVTQNITPTLDRAIYGFSLNAYANLGPYTLRSISSYRNSFYTFISDLDLTSAPLSLIEILEKAQQESQELRISRDFEHVKADVGLYFFHENLYGFTNVPLNRELLGETPLFVQGVWLGGRLSTKAEAAYFNVDYNFMPKWNFVVGGRYSTEKKTIDEAYAFDLTTPYDPEIPAATTKGDTNSASWSDFNPTGTLSYQPIDSLYTYVTVATGFKSGGFNLGGLQPPFAPEKLTDYEGGIKADWYSGKLRTNLSGFHYAYQNLQVSEIRGAVVQIVNAASASLNGMESDITFVPTSHWLFTLSASYLASRYNSFITQDPSRPGLGTINLAGNKLTQAPPYKADLAGQYTWSIPAGDLALRGEYARIGKTYFDPYNRDLTSQNAYQRINAYLNLNDVNDHWVARLYVLNAANVVTYSSKVVDSTLIGSPVVGSLEPPRTFGASLTYKFGR